MTTTDDRSPAFQFYPEKWMSHTRRLSDSAYRVYHEIILWMWTQSPDYCSIEKDPEAIACVLALPCDRITSALREIQNPHAPLLKEKGNKYVSNGLRKEVDKQSKRRKDAQNAANARWNVEKEPIKTPPETAMQPQCDGNATASDPQCILSLSLSPSLTLKTPPNPLINGIESTLKRNPSVVDADDPDKPVPPDRLQDALPAPKPNDPEYQAQKEIHELARRMDASREIQDGNFFEGRVLKIPIKTWKIWLETLQLLPGQLALACAILDAEMASKKIRDPLAYASRVLFQKSNDGSLFEWMRRCKPAKIDVRKFVRGEI